MVGYMIWLNWHRMTLTEFCIFNMKILKGNAFPRMIEKHLQDFKMIFSSSVHFSYNLVIWKLNELSRENNLWSHSWQFHLKVFWSINENLWAKYVAGNWSESPKYFWSYLVHIIFSSLIYINICLYKRIVREERCRFLYHGEEKQVCNSHNLRIKIKDIIGNICTLYWIL